MRIVVTGAAGFIGGHLVRRLIAEGHDVIGFDRRSASGPSGATIVTADLTLPEGFARLRDRSRAVDAVVHLAARPGVRDRAANLAELRHRDIVLTTAAVMAATPAATPLIATSSSSVYGGARRAGDALRASRESDPLDPRGGYAVAKSHMERLLDCRAADGGPVSVLRPFTVVGERQRPDMALALWLDAARTSRPVTVFGSLDRTRDFTDVRIVIDAILHLLDRPAAPGVINVGTGEPRTLGDLLSAVEQVTGASLDVQVRPAAAEEVADTYADTARLRALGVEPRTDLTDVVRRQWMWLGNEGHAEPAPVADGGTRTGSVADAHHNPDVDPDERLRDVA